ncbi:hypothetical protein Clacol_004052 [Clathrus columnatus]|uniref:Cytochrome P450 n=1 Tax=Clathrus columnatus TaxID=1419009 RepID=A0AAV5A8P2_9AGAM|nr:hypothetical protein Clacol_004052 [Clathrus columnatus]
MALNLDLESYLTPIKLATAALVVSAIALTRRRDPYEDIPTVGSSNPIWSYIDGFRFLSAAPHQKEGIFRIPTPIGWIVVLAGTKHIDELRTKRGEELSASAAMRQVTSGDYTFGAEIFDKPYNVPLVRTKLTRYIGAFFDNTRDEVMLTCDELLPSETDSNWKAVSTHSVCQLITGRAANRSYITDPSIYRDPGYLRVMMSFAKSAIQGGTILRFFPDFVKPIIAPIVTNVPASINTATRYLSKTIESRMKNYEKYGSDYPEKEDDMLSWFIDLVDQEDRNLRHLIMCILHVNAAAINTTSMSMYAALNALASHPEYIEPLREEIQSVVADYGWSKVSMGRMQKLDSFLMEAMRFCPPTVLTSPRLAMVDYVFSNGIRLPKDALVAVPTIARHMDDEVFPNAKTFDGFRFCKPQSATDDRGDSVNRAGTSASSKLTTLSSDYLLFGLGEHACPGRFFAANLIKLTISHMLMTYDIKLDPTCPPSGRYVTADFQPSPKDVLLFRKKETV